MKIYYVGVCKDKWTGHDVVEGESGKEVNETNYPQYDYMIGPYTDKTTAEDRARIEENKTGMFHPFPGHPR